ncbi:hypothetical protein BD410DRAFT_457254 [Rickenella mellea]|uniref:Uncharacterized protein n=1 Tax=Rickenella mellea TaxID=50990 RepID=A0A4Y7PU27_9AGAM|nr:hypothetical protein BD410DRAFT_457254 [Rickenella mellea]
MIARSWASLLQHLVLPDGCNWNILTSHPPSTIKHRLIPVGNLSATGQALEAIVSSRGLEIYQECGSELDPKGPQQGIDMLTFGAGTYEYASVAFLTIVQLVKNTYWANATDLLIHFSEISIEEEKPAMWKKLFEMFTGLTCLKISLHVRIMGNLELGLAQALSIPKKLMDGTSSFLLPKLRILHMRNAKFVKYSNQARTFGRCFQVRKKIAPLQELILVNSSSLSRAILRILKESIEMVEERDEDPTESEIEDLESFNQESSSESDSD